jgi:CheY-like chemotaxis protein
MVETLESREYLSAAPIEMGLLHDGGSLDAPGVRPFIDVSLSAESPAAGVFGGEMQPDEVTPDAIIATQSSLAAAVDRGNGGIVETKAYLSAPAFADSAGGDSAREIAARGTYSYAGRPPRQFPKPRLEGVSNGRPATRPPRVLIIEDEAAGRNALTILLKRRGFDVVAVATVAEGIKELGNDPDRVIVDLVLPDGRGEAILQQVQMAHLHARVTVMTGVEDPARLEHVRQLGAQAVLHKPISLAELFQDLANDRPN